MTLKYLLVIFLFLGLTYCKTGISGKNSDKARGQVISTDDYKIWQLIDQASVGDQLDAEQLPREYQLLKLNRKKALTRLAQLEPKERTRHEIRYEKTAVDDIEMQFPWDDGGFYTFLVKNSNVFSKDLAKKFPDIRSYSGVKTDDGSIHLRLDTNPSGLYAMITTPSKTLFIRPLNDEGKYYLCYDKDKVDQDNKKFYEPPIKSRHGNK